MPSGYGERRGWNRSAHAYPCLPGMPAIPKTQGEVNALCAVPQRHSFGGRMGAQCRTESATRMHGAICLGRRADFRCRHKGGTINDQTIWKFRTGLFSQARFRRYSFEKSKGPWPWRAHDGKGKAAQTGAADVQGRKAASGPWQKASFRWPHASGQAAAQADVWEAGRVLPVAGAGRDVSGGACADVDSGIMPVCRGRFLTETSAGTARPFPAWPDRRSLSVIFRAAYAAAFDAGPVRRWMPRSGVKIPSRCGRVPCGGREGAFYRAR